MRSLITALATTRGARLLFLAVVWALYIVIYGLFAPAAGVTVGIFVVLPVILATWLFGMRAGLGAWVVGIVVNRLLYTVVHVEADEALMVPGMIFSFSVLLFIVVVIGWVRQLSRRLQAELTRRRQVEAAERQRTAELEAIYQTSVQLNASIQLQPVIKAILNEVSALLKPQRVHLFLYDGEALAFGVGISNGELQDAPFLQEPRRDGLTYTVARSGERIIVPDVDAHPIYQDMKWGGAIAAVPLAVGDRVYGVVSLSYDQPHTFGESELRVFELLANQAAVAIRNAGDYEDARKQTVLLEQRVAERTAELRRSKENAEAIINNSFDVIVRLNADGRILQVNGAFGRVFGAGGGEGCAFAALFVDGAAIDAALKTVVASRSVMQFEATGVRGSEEFITDVALVPFESDEDAVEIICNVRDVTERRRVERQQQELTSGLRKVLALAFDLISCTDIDTMWKHAVEAARDVLGLERCAIYVDRGEVMIGTYGTDRFGNTTAEHANHWRKTGVWRDRDHLFTTDAPLWEVVDDEQREWRDGAAVSVGRGWIVITPIHSAYRFIGLLVNDTAITGTPLDEIKQEVVAVFCSFLGSLYEHKRVEEEMRKALEREKELNELKSRFTSMISHELRTPLASIQLSTDLLKRYFDRQTAEARAKHLDKIEGQVKHLTGMIEDVLTYAKAEQVGLQLQMTPDDLKSFCEEIAAEIRATCPTHTLLFRAGEGGDWMGVFDPKLMRQALTNLLLNAVKYSAAGSAVRFSLVREQGDAVLEVSDDGIGIPESDLPHIFDVFYRAENAGTVPGTGLGLALVRQIAEAHRGLIVCRSVVGVGTTFIMRIPFAPPASKQPESTTTADA